MALVYPRFVVNEFAPAFRLINELQGASRPRQCGRSAHKFRSWQPRPFQPRFDVTENKDSYELKGELPGVDQKNIEVAFTDEKTLTIKGSAERHHEEGTRPTTEAESKTEQPETTETQSEKAPASESDDASSYHKASVEDEYVDVSSSDATMSGGNPEAEAPKEVTSEEAPKTEEAPAKSERSRYWVSERSFGRFARSWTFEKNIQQDGVTASLKDGILSVVVPKAPVPENRRIEVQ